jgi:hypothetical protein
VSAALQVLGFYDPLELSQLDFWDEVGVSLPAVCCFVAPAY